MAPVQRAVSDLERKRAERLGAAERAVREAQAKLDELTRYHEDYLRRFDLLASAGLEGLGLRDYQTFLARLAAAIRGQREVLARVCVQRDAERSDWQRAATRAKAVDTVVEQWREDERRDAARLEQKESDERALRRRDSGN
jgi:flagellar export protein FliJ